MYGQLLSLKIDRGLAALQDSMGPASNFEKIFCAHIGNFTYFRKKRRENSVIYFTSSLREHVKTKPV